MPTGDVPTDKSVRKSIKEALRKRGGERQRERNRQHAREDWCVGVPVCLCLCVSLSMCLCVFPSCLDAIRSVSVQMQSRQRTFHIPPPHTHTHTLTPLNPIHVALVVLLHQVPLLKAASHGNVDPSHVVNVSSTAGNMDSSSPMDNAPSYAASKAAANKVTQVLASYLVQDNINVNCIAPAVFPSKMTYQYQLKTEELADVSTPTTHVYHTDAAPQAPRDCTLGFMQCPCPAVIRHSAQHAMQYAIRKLTNQPHLLLFI